MRRQLLPLFLLTVCFMIILAGCDQDSGRPAGTVQPYDDVRSILGEEVVLQPEDYNVEDIPTFWYNLDTVFVGNQELAAQIIEEGKDPGQGVRGLHAQGITGAGVTLAIIDQPLYPEGHPEYAGKILAYHTVDPNESAQPSSMHGPAVTSLLVGETIGTAPEARLYYVAMPSWLGDASYGAEALRWLITQNEALPEGEKIRAVSISTNFANSSVFKNHAAWEEAVAEAEDAGMMIIDCREGYETCLFWPSYFDRENRDEISSSRIGSPNGDFAVRPAQALATPIGYRTTAEQYADGSGGGHYRPGHPSYAYDAEGGHSWAAPYGTGVLALGWQLNPDLDGEQMAALLRQTAYTDAAGELYLDPVAFVAAVQETVVKN